MFLVVRSCKLLISEIIWAFLRVEFKWAETHFLFQIRTMETSSLSLNKFNIMNVKFHDFSYPKINATYHLLP